MSEPADDWKDDLLDDFLRWIDDCTDCDAPGSEPAPPEPDLRDLYAEFAALRQETRLQNREQARAGRELARAAERYDAAVGSMTQYERDLAVFARHAARSAENDCLRSILDLHDVLARGLAAATELVNRRGLLFRPPRGLDGIVQGYGIALRRFDRTLSGFGVVRLQATGQPFDPRTMHAVEIRQVEGVQDGIVLDEQRCGYVRDADVLRLADVVVNRPGSEG